MGLVTANTVGLSGLVAPKPNVQIFDVDNDGSNAWVKPAGCTRVYIECIGAGGGAEGGSGGVAGAGGGGGAIALGVYAAESLPATLTVAVGAGGNGASTYAAGTAGGNTIVSGSGFVLSAFGGGGGGS